MDSLAARFSFADMPPVGMETGHGFRIRTVYEGQRSAWVEGDGEIVTFLAPEPFAVRMFDRDEREFRLTMEPITVADTKRRNSLHYIWEISEDDRQTYTQDGRRNVSCGHVRCIKFQKDSTTVGLTYWAKITAWHGTISGATQYIDFTMDSARAREDDQQLYASHY